MKTRAGSGWQTLLADLSIILFMVTAGALSQAGEGTRKAALEPSVRSAPLAVFRAGAGAPPLGEWLAAQSADSRQQLSIVAQFTPGEQIAALEQAGALLRAAGAAGVRARLVVEPGPGGVTAALAYDAPDLALARGLLSPPGNKTIPE